MECLGVRDTFGIRHQSYSSLWTHLILHDILDASSVEVETVTECEVPSHWWFGATAPQLPQSLLHRTIIPLDEAWKSTHKDIT